MVRRAAGAFGAVAAATSLMVSASGLVLPAAPASATTCGAFTWTGLAAVGGDTNWSNGLNWQGNTPPASNSCVSLTFPFSAAHTGVTNNDLLNLQINTLDITGSYTLTGGPSSAVSMVDSTTTPAGVTDSANSTIQLSLNVVNNTTFAVASGNSLTLSGVISDAPAPNNPATAITASGPGTLILSNGNTYTGKTQVNGGTVELTNTSALGVPGNTVTVATGAILQLGPSGTSPFIVPQRVTLAGLVVGGGSDQRLTGLLTLADTGGSLASNGLLTVNQVAGNGALTVTAGTVKLAGSSNNTYGGGTVVAGGTLELDVVPTSATGLATPGLLTVDSGAGVKLDAPGQLDPSSTGGLTIVGTGSANLNGNSSTVANLTLDSTSGSGAPTVKDTAVSPGTLSVSSAIVSEGTGLPAVIAAPLDLAPSGTTVQTIDSLVVSGPLSGGALTLSLNGATPSFGLCGSGTSTSPCVAMVISGVSSGYTGPVTVSSGMLDVTGTMSSTPVTVGPNGFLTGDGVVGGVTSSGTLAPGTTVAYQAGANLTDADKPGVLSVSSLSLSGGTMNVRLDGTSPGSGGTTCSGYDQVKVANGGNAALGTGTTTLDVFSDKHSNGVPCRTPLNGEPYTIISSPSTTGTFNGYLQGAAVTDPQTPYQYTISYTGNVVLTANNNSTVVVALTSTGGSSPSNPSTYGQQLTFNATVSGPSGTPTGTVTFSDTNTTGGNTVNFPIACQQTGTATVTLSAGLAPCTPASALPGDPNAGDTNTFTATYSGNSTYGGNTGSVGQVVNTQPTSTALSSGNPSPSTYGEPVTFTATITPHSTGTQATTVSPPTGSVTFSVTNNSNTTALLDCTGKTVTTNGGTTTATCVTSDLPTGSDSVTAAYTGDGNYTNSATSSGTPQTVNKASTTVTLSSGNPDPSVFGQPVTFTATVAPTTPPEGPNPPGGSVTFSANGSPLTDCSGSVSTTGGTTTANCTTGQLPVGNPVSVTAVYNGDTNYASSPNSNTVNQTVNQASTSTGLASSQNPSAAGQPVTYTATVTVISPGVGTPTGTVTFTDGTNAVNCGTGTQPLSPSGKATCTVTYQISGGHSITATYSGDTDFAGSASSPPLAQNVVAGATTTNLSPGSPSTSAYGQQVTFTATINHTFTAVAPPSGTVTFSAGGSALTDCNAVPVSTTGSTTSATCQTVDLPTGNPVSVTATYNGDTDYAVSTSTAQPQTVNPASTTTTVAAGSPNPSVFGQSVSFTATIHPTTAGPSAPTGTVVFQSGGNTLDCDPAPVTSTNATCTTASLPVGTDTVTAAYQGDGNYQASPQSSGVSQTVNQAATTVNVTASPNPAAVGQTVTLTATVAAAAPGGGNPTGTVEFFDPGSPIPGCVSQPLSTSGGRTTATCSVSYNSIGDRSVSATYSGDSNFTGSNSSSLTQKVVHSVRPAGYWMVASDGGIFSFGPGAHFYGSTGAQHLNAPIVGMAEDPATGGYWLVASDGGIFAFNAPFFGSTGAQHLNAPIVGMAAAPDGNGYWLVASDGGIFTFGPSAHFYGSTGAIHLNQPIVGMAAAPDGNGYWLVASDGGIFAFGPSATFFGSTGSTPLNRPMVGMAAAPDGNGYWLVASDGGIFSFGPSAQFFGSTGNIHLNRPIVGMAAAPDGNGYWLVASDGGIFAFGPSAGFYGSMGATRLNQPVVGMAAAG